MFHIQTKQQPKNYGKLVLNKEAKIGKGSMKLKKVFLAVIFYETL